MVSSDVVVAVLMGLHIQHIQIQMEWGPNPARADSYFSNLSKLSVREEPMSLPSDAFSGLYMCQDCFSAPEEAAPLTSWGAYRAVVDALTGFNSTTSWQGRDEIETNDMEGEGKRENERMKGWELGRVLKSRDLFLVHKHVTVTDNWTSTVHIRQDVVYVL